MSGEWAKATRLTCESSQLAQEAWKLFPTGAKWSNTEHGPEKTSKVS